MPLRKTIRFAQAVINLLTSARFVVNGDSMLPGLAARESVLVVRPRFSWNRLQRGDVVVLRRPFCDGRTYLKRIVGLPNEEIYLEDGLVYVDGTMLEETYISRRPESGRDPSRIWWTGPGEYFVLGDNRRDSHDSRAFGPVHRGLILGRVWFRCWPPGAWRPVRGGDRPAG